jgi:uncharacterized protein
LPAGGGLQPVYTLHCRGKRGESVRFRYDPHRSRLTTEDGAPVVADARPAAFEPAPRISPSQPGRKSASPRTLKIQLGLQCNYSCSYCNQSGEIDAATVTRTADAAAFLEGLPGWLEGAPERIEFWGGEPFVYFAKLERLVPALHERFPQAELAIVTNGSLIDEQIIGFIERYDIMVAVSHDGPGQHLRGPDPFDDPERAKWLRELWRRRRRARRVTFNVVFTGANCDVGKTCDWFARKLDDPEVALDTEGAVSVYGADARSPGRFTAEQFALLERSMVDAFASGKAQRYGAVAEKARDFLDSLYMQRPSSALGQKCGMDRDDQLAVDLSGRVMTCQNTGAKGKHGIGNLSAFEEIRLDTARHWSQRESCNYCPVLQLCKGGCMYLEGDLFAQSCENEYHYNYAVLAGVIGYVTGLRLERIEGDMRRPSTRKTIPIRAAEQA